MSLSYEPTQYRRSCLGLIVGVIAGSVAFALGLIALSGFAFEGAAGFIAISVWFSVLFVGGPATVLVGVPIYLLLRGRVRANPLNCSAVGALVGALAVMGWVILLAAEREPRVFILTALIAGTCGAIGGFIFWLVAGREINRDLDPQT